MPHSKNQLLQKNTWWTIGNLEKADRFTKIQPVCSNKNLLDHPSPKIGQPLETPRMEIGQLVLIDPHQTQQRSMYIATHQNRLGFIVSSRVSTVQHKLKFARFVSAGGSFHAKRDNE